MFWYVLGVAVVLSIGLFHLAYWVVLIMGGVQILNSLQDCGKPRGEAPANPQYARPPAKDLELEANGHTVLFNPLMARSKELGLG